MPSEIAGVAISVSPISFSAICSKTRAGLDDEDGAVFARVVDLAVAGHGGCRKAGGTVGEPLLIQPLAGRHFEDTQDTVVAADVQLFPIDDRRLHIGAFALLTPGDVVVGLRAGCEADVSGRTESEPRKSAPPDRARW